MYFIRLGSPDGPRVEITATPLREVTAEAASDTCLDHGAIWAPLGSRVLPDEVRAPVRRDEDGIGGLGRSGVIIRLVARRGMDAVEALRAVETAQGGRLPPELPAALLAASRARRPVHGAEGPSIIAGIARKGGVPQGPVPHLSGKELEALAWRVVEEAAAGATDLNVPEGTVDRARFLLALGAVLWRPEARRRFRDVDLCTEAGMLFSILAGVHLSLAGEGKNVVEVAGTGIAPVDVGTAMIMWPQVLEWDRGIDAQTLLWFCPGGRYDSSEATLDRGRWRAEDVEGIWDPALCRATARAMLEETTKAARYVPLGRFTLHLPEEVPLRRWNVEAMRISVDPAGMWVGLLTPSGIVPLSFRWEPGKPLRTTVVDAIASPPVEAVLAALWHDLRVAGEASFPRRGRGSAVEEKHPQRTVPAAERRAGPHVRTLPRLVRLPLEGHREWGEVAERERIAKRAHAVRGHIRMLHTGWKRSPQALEAARSFGVVLPEGYTFVRPFVRGGMKGTQGEEPVVKARGLGTVIALLGIRPDQKGAGAARS